MILSENSNKQTQQAELQQLAVLVAHLRTHENTKVVFFRLTVRSTGR